MEKLNFGYSLKNIPTPNERTYKLKLIEKIELLIKHMRWKAIFFTNRNSKPSNNTAEAKFGSKSNQCPPQVKELMAFEDDLIKLVKEIRFRKVKNQFQNKLKDDNKKIRSSNKTLTPADKTSNMYRLEKQEYKHLLTNAITSTHRKARNDTAIKINRGGIKHAKEAKVLDRIEINGTGNCFMTLKDHKINFINHPTTRLINPAKNQIGRISKEILDRINSLLCSNLKVNEWKNTSSMITGFRNIKDKHLYKFLIFDKKDFYPSIKESLFHEALKFTIMHVNIIKRDIEVMFHSRKSLLYNNGIPWFKKQGMGFDVTMGAYDGTEICELIGIFMLSLLGTKCDSKNIGLYKDDGLSIFRHVSGPKLEKIQKHTENIQRKNVRCYYRMQHENRKLSRCHL